MNDPRQEWRTPKDFWDVLNREFEFQLDAAASEENALCGIYFTEEDNALHCKWTGDWIYRVYCNPGFSSLFSWMDKGWTEAQTSPGAVVAVVGLVSPSTKWWTFAENGASEIRLLSPRVQFDPAPGVEKSSNARENCLVIFRRGPLYPPKARIWTWKWK